MNTTERTYTREQVDAALNAAANMLDGTAEYESSDSIRDQDRASLLVNAAGYLLDHPHANLDQAIMGSYALEPADLDLEADAHPDEIRAATIETVKGWIE